MRTKGIVAAVCLTIFAFAPAYAQNEIIRADWVLKHYVEQSNAEIGSSNDISETFRSELFEEAKRLEELPYELWLGAIFYGESESKLIAPILRSYLSSMNYERVFSLAAHGNPKAQFLHGFIQSGDFNDQLIEWELDSILPEENYESPTARVSYSWLEASCLGGVAVGCLYTGGAHRYEQHYLLAAKMYEIACDYGNYLGCSLAADQYSSFRPGFTNQRLDKLEHQYRVRACELGHSASCEQAR